MFELSASEGGTHEAGWYFTRDSPAFMEVEMINMDFITGLPRSQNQYDSIWLIVDRLTKSAHFLPVRTNYSGEVYAKIYIEEIVRLNGAPVSIIFDRGTQFSS